MDRADRDPVEVEAGVVKRLREMAAEPWKHDGGSWPDPMLEAADRIEMLEVANIDFQQQIDALSARPTPPAEIVRYEPMVQPFRGEDVVTMAVVNFGQWVRYEDHAAALAAERAARKEAEALIVTLTAGDPTKWTALDHPKGEAA